jgi:poly(3-hydroxybutyrate) depolymerase
MRKKTVFFATLAAFFIQNAFVEESRETARIAPPLTAGQFHFSTYRSEIDDTDQPFSFYLPVGWRAEAAHPCVIILHGFGGRLAGSVSAGEKTWADTYGWILAYPDGRGNANYDWLGEDDVLCVRAALIADCGADARRTYLVGFSMGGHGVYRLAVRFPDKFAAAAPGAGWTDYEEFYPQWYQQASSPKLPNYLDPTRRPLLRRAAALPWAENALPTPFRVFYNTGDTVNPPHNALVMLSAWRALGHAHLEEVPVAGGHGANWRSEDAFPFFVGREIPETPNSVVINADALRYGGAFWARLDGFREWLRPARIAACAGGSDGRIELTTRNVERFALTPPVTLRTATGDVAVTIDGEDVYCGPGHAELSFSTVRDAAGFPSGWTINTINTSNSGSQAGGWIKAQEFEGPIADALRGPVKVIYGASGTAEQTERNLRDAELFCALWNGMLVLRWGGEYVPADRKHNWYHLPYPFTAGAFVDETQILRAVPDKAVAGQAFLGRNLVLFGEANSNEFIAALGDSTTLRPAADGNGVTVGGRVYAGPTVGWMFLTPRPAASGRLALVCKGFLSSLPELVSWGAGNASKDVEQMPWLYPDYVVFDSALPLGGTGADDSTYRYLPEGFLEAGFFTANWTLDEAPPTVRAVISGPPDPLDPGAFAGPAVLTLTAVDGAGESGVDRIEWRFGATADWRTYLGPILIVAQGETVIEYRAMDCGFSHLYGPDPTTGRIRAVNAAFNTSAAGLAILRINGEAVAPEGFLTERLDARLAGQFGARGRLDVLTFRIKLGEVLAAQLRQPEARVKLKLGDAFFGPWPMTDGKVFRGAATEDGRGRSEGRLRTARRTGGAQLLVRVRGLRLDAYWDLPSVSQGETTTPIILGLQVGDGDVIETELAVAYARKERRLPGRLRWRLNEQ